MSLVLPAAVTQPMRLIPYNQRLEIDVMCLVSQWWRGRKQIPTAALERYWCVRLLFLASRHGELDRGKGRDEDALSWLRGSQYPPDLMLSGMFLPRHDVAIPEAEWAKVRQWITGGERLSILDWITGAPISQQLSRSVEAATRLDRHYQQLTPANLERFATVTEDLTDSGFAGAGEILGTWTSTRANVSRVALQRMLLCLLVYQAWAHFRYIEQKQTLSVQTSLGEIHALITELLVTGFDPESAESNGVLAEVRSYLLATGRKDRFELTSWMLERPVTWSDFNKWRSKLKPRR